MTKVNCVSGISQKYDSALDYGINMYDQLPYQRNSDVCNARSVALFSGNIVKYYLCHEKENAFPVDNQDDKIEYLLEAIRKKENQLSSSSEEAASEFSENEVTDEQIQTLLTDNSENTDFASDSDNSASSTPRKTVNLDDIEDW